MLDRTLSQCFLVSFLSSFLFRTGAREEKTPTLGAFLSVCVKEACLWYQGHLITPMHFHICTPETLSCHFSRVR